MLKFDAGIFRGELPIGLGVVGIAVVLPGGDFVDEGLFIGNAASEALGRRTPSSDSAKLDINRWSAPCHKHLTRAGPSPPSSKITR